MKKRTIYLDNAATSFPKPWEVLQQMVKKYARQGVSPGRSGYDLSTEAAGMVYGTRQKLARFFGAPEPERVVFAANATDALNTAIQGLVVPGDHVVSTRLEHNSVLRPLYHLRKRGIIEYDLVGFKKDGCIGPEYIESVIKPNTSLVIINHASNVLGTVQPIAEIAAICKERKVPLLLDVAQSAGHIPIDMQALGVTAIAFTGHKALLGPSGIGGLVISPELDIKTTRFGGTGVDSSSLTHTQAFPDRLEAGTLNFLGILGLSLSLDYLEHEGTGHIKKEMLLVRHLYEGLSSFNRVVIHSPPPVDWNVPVLTCTIKGYSSTDVGDILDGDYGIAVRTGLHCAPFVHVDLGTDETGAIRFSPGRFNSIEDIELVLTAVAEMVAMKP